MGLERTEKMGKWAVGEPRLVTEPVFELRSWFAFNTCAHTQTHTQTHTLRTECVLGTVLEAGET